MVRRKTWCLKPAGRAPEWAVPGSGEALAWQKPWRCRAVQRWWGWGRCRAAGSEPLQLKPLPLPHRRATRRSRKQRNKSTNSSPSSRKSILNRLGSSPHFRSGGNFSSGELEHLWPQAHQKPVVPSLLSHHCAGAHASHRARFPFPSPRHTSCGRGQPPQDITGSHTFNFTTWLLEIGSALCISFQNNCPHPHPTPFLSWCETMVI